MRILIIGAGDIGFQLSKRLSRQKHDITMIDSDPQKVKQACEQLDAFVLEGSGSSYKTLKAANLADMEIVAAMTDRDETNLLACKLAKKVGVPTTIARVRDPEITTEDYILSPAELGTDLIIHPEKETADDVVSLIHNPHATYAIEIEGGRIELLGLTIDQNSALLYIPLRQLGARLRDLQLCIVAINRNYETIIPKGDDMFIPGDQIFIVSHHDHAVQFTELLGKRDIPIRDVMIFGGGLVSRFIAQSLEDEANVKIIESNPERAHRLADALPHTLVIQGDGTDFDLLDNEGISEMDAFIAVTGDDENNIITTLLAQHVQVPRAIALVNKVANISIAPKIGLDAVVSKQLLTVNAVQRYIHQQQVATIEGLPGIDAQLIEYIVGPDCKIIRKPLIDLGFPKDAIIGSVLRGDTILTPQGGTQIRSGDKVVVFTLPQALSELDNLFTRTRRRDRFMDFLQG